MLETYKTKIHMGCGKRYFGPDWFHVDSENYPHVEWHDIFNFPFKSGSIDLIYASHLIEYFDRFEVQNLLKEWHALLKPSGILRIAVPDFATIAGLYISEDFTLNKFIGPLYGRMESNSKIIYHKMVYDFPTLRETLKQAGFEKIRPYDWRETEHANIDDHSQAYLPHMDKEYGELISLNVEAVK